MTLSPATQTWLLNHSDPSVVWRFLIEVMALPPDDARVLGARRRIGHEGWAAELLALRQPQGQWDNAGTSRSELYRPKYTATNWRLLVLAELGMTCADPRVAQSAELLLRVYDEYGALDGAESEACVTGNAARMMALFGLGADARVQRALQWLISSQKADGGWNCFPSDTGTLDAWEALAAFSVIPSEERSPTVKGAIERGAQFYLERHLLNEGSTPYAPWQRLHYPNHYYYDFLVGLDVLTRLGFSNDKRLSRALDLLESKPSADGRWLLEGAHPDVTPGEDYNLRTPFFPFCLEMVGWPSAWITVTALAVLRRAGRL
jgi:hypothetical protein